MFVTQLPRLLSLTFVTCCLFLSASPLVAQFAISDKADWGFLGVTTEALESGDGVLINYVFAGAAADNMGMKVGDEVILVNDRRVRDPDTFAKALKGKNVGTTMRFTIRRDGKRQKIRGKLGSFKKSMARIESQVQSLLLGKPLPDVPQLLWWNPDEGVLEDRKAGMEALKGKVTVIFAYDACTFCQERRFKPFVEWSKKVKGEAINDELVSMVGVYYNEAEPHEDNTESASILYDFWKPEFQGTLAHFPKGTKPDRLKHAYLYRHGMMVVDHDGMVRYVQILGKFDHRMSKAYGDALTRADAALREKENAEATEAGN